MTMTMPILFVPLDRRPFDVWGPDDLEAMTSDARRPDEVENTRAGAVDTCAMPRAV